MAQTSTIAEMATAVGDRLQDPTFTFWLENFEVYAGLAEGISELLLIIGRPTQIFNTVISLTPNTCFQAMPANVLTLTNINLGGTFLKKTVLHSLDYLQASWGSSWQSDRAAVPARWAPLGLNYFIVHPAPYYPIQVQIAAIEYPILTTWPPNGTELSPFHREVNQALEMYAASYCRLKEVGNDAQIGFELYKQFQQIAQRLTTIEDRRDSLVFSQSFGAPTAPSQVSKR